MTTKETKEQFPGELTDQLLARYEKPEDLTGKDCAGNLRRACVRPGPRRAESVS